MSPNIYIVTAFLAMQLLVVTVISCMIFSKVDACLEIFRVIESKGWDCEGNDKGKRRHS